MNVAHDHFIQTKHKCLDRPGLDPSDVRCCPHWYRCEKPEVADGDLEFETARILILNLNYSIVLDETRGTVGKQVTVIYDSERLKPILRDLGATKMTIYCPADLQDYPYAVVDFPDIVQSRAAFQQLQGRCLGYSGRHLRIVYAPLYDYTFGGRHTVPEDTRDIIIMSLEPEKLRLARVPKQKPDESSSPASSPQKNKYSRMVVTKYGRRIQIPSNLVSEKFGGVVWFDDVPITPTASSAEWIGVTNDQETKITTMAKSSRPHIIIPFYSVVSVVFEVFSPDRL